MGHLLWPFNLSIFNNYTLRFHHEAKVGEQKSAHLKTNKKVISTLIIKYAILNYAQCKNYSNNYIVNRQKY